MLTTSRRDWTRWTPLWLREEKIHWGWAKMWRKSEKALERFLFNISILLVLSSSSSSSSQSSSNIGIITHHCRLSHIIAGYRTVEKSGQQEHRELWEHCNDQQGTEHLEGDHHYLHHFQNHHHQHFEWSRLYNTLLSWHYHCLTKLSAFYCFSWMRLTWRMVGRWSHHKKLKIWATLKKRWSLELTIGWWDDGDHDDHDDNDDRMTLIAMIRMTLHRWSHWTRRWRSRLTSWTRWTWASLTLSATPRHNWSWSTRMSSLLQWVKLHIRAFKGADIHPSIHCIPSGQGGQPARR